MNKRLAFGLWILLAVVFAFSQEPQMTDTAERLIRRQPRAELSFLRDCKTTVEPYTTMTTAQKAAFVLRVVDGITTGTDTRQAVEYLRQRCNPAERAIIRSIFNNYARAAYTARVQEATRFQDSETSSIKGL